MVRIEDGAGYFQFTNRSAGRVVIQPPGQKFERIVEGPVDDWVIELAKPQPAEVKVLPKREVVFRFKHPSGVPPRGTVSLTIQDNLEKRSNTAHSVEKEITNGEARAEIEIGGGHPSRRAAWWAIGSTASSSAAACCPSLLPTAPVRKWSRFRWCRQARFTRRRAMPMARWRAIWGLE